MAWEFTSSNEVIDFGNSYTVNGTDLSLSIWAYFDDLASDEQALIMKYNSNSDANKSFLWRTLTTGAISFGTNNGASQVIQISNTGLLSENVWTHLGVVYDDSANNCDFYINGSQVGESSSGSLPNIQSTTTSITLGKWESNVDSLNGKLAEGAVWNRTLSASDMAVLGNRFAPSFFPEGLIFYSPLHGKYSPEIDYGSGSTGTVTAATVFPHPPIIYPNKGQLRYFPSSGNVPPNTPSVSSPSDTATNVPLEVALTSSAFSDDDALDTHKASQWQLSTDNGFSDIVWDTGTDTTNLISVKVNETNGTFGGTADGYVVLDQGRTYYVHVRHQDNNDNWSNYSTVTSYTTKKPRGLMLDKLTGKPILIGR